MEQKKFIQALRKVVRDEVKTVIKQELTEILREGLQSTISELQPNKKPLTESVNKPIKKKQNGVFKENKFSDILNETSALHEQNPMSNYASLLSEDIKMTSADAQGFGMQRKSLKNVMGFNKQPTAVLNDPETGNNMAIDPIIAKAMTRDYTSLMKAIDEKKGRK